MATPLTALERLVHLFKKEPGDKSLAMSTMQELGLDLTVNESKQSFTLEINPHPDLWISSAVVFQVNLPEGFPKTKPTARCIQVDESIRNDSRLLMEFKPPVVPKPPPTPPPPTENDDHESVASEFSCDSSNLSSSSEEEALRLKQLTEQPKVYRSRIEPDGTVHINLFESQYMGWLEFYPLEVILFSLRIMFRKSDFELAPEQVPRKRTVPFPVSVISAVHEEQGPRMSMEDRVSCDDYCFVPFQSLADKLSLGELLSRALSLGETHAEPLLVDRAQGGDTGRTGGGIPNIGNLEAPNGRKVAFHAVFDGHGGDKAADTASMLVEDFFLASLEDASMSVARALYNAVLKAEEALANQALAEKEEFNHVVNTSGSTICATAIDLTEGILYCANVGDTRAVLCRANGVAIELSDDHKASRPDEVARVVHTGGFVSYGRVLGMLAVSRALGDAEMKSPNTLITATPAMTQVELEDGDHFVLIACDGLFDVMTSQEAVDFVKAELVGVLDPSAEHLEEICQKLVRHALADLNSRDNVSVIIVLLSRAECDNECTKSEPGITDKTSEFQLEDSLPYFGPGLPTPMSSPLNEEKKQYMLSPKVKEAIIASRVRKHASMT